MTAAAPDLSRAATTLELAQHVVDAGVRTLAAAPGGVDEHQVIAYDLAHAASALATGNALLSYGAKGELEAAITCAYIADAVHDLAAKVFGREAEWGVDQGALDKTREFLGDFRAPSSLPPSPTRGPATSTPTSSWSRTPSGASPRSA